MLKELKNYNLKIIIILEETDSETIRSIKNFNCKIVYQNNKGYGDALNLGINNVDTKYFCIFNADGSFNPIELDQMYEKLKFQQNDLVFASRYESGCKSDDDTIITYLGNFIFYFNWKNIFWAKNYGYSLHFCNGKYFKSEKFGIV